MTLSDLLKLLLRNLKLLIILPVALTIVAIGWSLLTHGNFTATASFITSGNLALAQGLASQEAAGYSSSDVTISCSSDSAIKQVMISATGSDSAACVDTANKVAEETIKKYKTADNTVTVSATNASYAQNDRPSLLKTALLAIFAGLFIAICIIVFIDALKSPIKSPENAENDSELPVLGLVPSSEGGERLLANLQFRCDKRPSAIAIVPVGTAATAPVVARELAAALERIEVRVKLVKGSPHAKKFQVNVPEDAAIVVSCEPITMGMGAAYIAHNADATILCVSEWTDSKKQLLSTLNELKLAKANIAGIAYLPEEKKPKEPKEPKKGKEAEGE